MPKGVPNKKYAPEFNTERAYLKESPEELAIERRGRGSRPFKEGAESGERGFAG